jgi:uncharacterized membrane protein YeaQ/YmgE (transglycosylase-associated protein family)
MTLVAMALVGAAAGWLAARAMGMRVDPFVAMGVGMIGATLGVMALRLLLSVVHGLALLAAAIAGALLLIWLWRVAVERR